MESKKLIDTINQDFKVTAIGSPSELTGDLQDISLVLHALWDEQDFLN